MQRSSSLYTVGFAGVVCAICSVLVSGSTVALKQRQERNVLLDKQAKVLMVCGLMEPNERVARAEIQRRFEENIRLRVVNLETGEYADEEVTQPYDPVEAARDPALGMAAPENNAGVAFLPKYAVVYHVLKHDAIDTIILQVWGRGLWSTLYGYLALDKDCTTVRGLIFYEHGETPGLGGEVDNPRWKRLWPGRKVYDETGQPSIKVVKGAAGPPDQDPHRVDGLSGATITSRGVENLLNFWLSTNGYKTYLATFRQSQA